MAIQPKKERICSKCGAVLHEGDAFCYQCGTPYADMDKPPQAEQKADRVCPKCGAILHGDDSFCFQCGAAYPGSNAQQADEPQPAAGGPGGTTVAVQGDAAKKVPGWMKIAAIAAVLVVVAIGGFFLIQNRRRAAYRQQVSELSIDIANNMILMEENVNRMNDVLYASIRQISDPTTNPYTQDQYGIFYNDVQQAVQALCADADYSAAQENVRSGRAAIEQAMDALGDAPKGCEDIQEDLETFYQCYQMLTDWGLDNTDIAPETFASEYNSMAEETLASLQQLWENPGMTPDESTLSLPDTQEATGTPLSVSRAWDNWLAQSYENEIYYFVDDYDCDGDAEAFGITGEIQGSYGNIYQQVAIYFINSQGEVSLVCNTQPGSDIYQLYGYFGSTNELGQPMLLTPVESQNKFIVWELDDGFTDSVSLIWGVKDDQPYQPAVSGQFQHFNSAIVGYPNAYQIDYSQGYPVQIDYRFDFDPSTGEFTPEIDTWW